MNRESVVKQSLVAICGIGLVLTAILILLLSAFAPARINELWVPVALSIQMVLAAGVVVASRRSKSRAAREQGLLHLSSVIENIDAIAWEANPQTRALSFTSKSWQELTGRPVSRQEKWGDHIIEDDRRTMLEEWNRLVSSGAQSDFEYRLRTESGETRWVSDHAIVVRTSSGESQLVRGRIVDITKQKTVQLRLDLVMGAQRALSAGKTKEEALHQVIKSVCRSLDWQVGNLWLSSRGGELAWVDGWKISDAYLPFVQETMKWRPKLGEGLPGTVFKSGVPRWISETSTESFVERPSAHQVGLISGLAFPIKNMSSVVGVFEFFSTRTHEPDEDLLSMLESLGHQIGRFLAEKEEEDKLRFQTALFESLTKSTLDGMLLVSPSNQILSYNQQFVDMWGIPRHIIDSQSDEAAVKAVLDKVVNPDSFAARIEYLYENIQEKSRDEVYLKDGRVFDRWSSPLIGTDGQYYGRAWFFHDITVERQTQAELKLSRDRLRFLSEAGRLLASKSDDYESTLSTIARLAVPELADWCAVDLVDDKGDLRHVALHHTDPDKMMSAKELQEQFPPDPNSPLGPSKVVQTGNSEFYSSLPTELLQLISRDDRHLELLQQLGLHSAIIVPLIARGRILGAISLVTAESRRTYDQDDLELAESLARRAALAIDNARLLMDRGHIAKVLQESLLPPSLPSIPGFEVAGLYEPAGINHDVGGDFYDVFPYGIARWGIVMADVSGKGAEAAALTGLARYTIKNEAFQELEPGRILTALNRAMAEQSDDEKFCTAVYIRLEPVASGARLTVVNGGHPSPIVFRADGTIMHCHPQGPALGIDSSADFGVELLDLHPGEGIVLYTDGLTEARRDGELFGEERLADIIRQHCNFSAEKLAQEIKHSVLEFGTSADDIAILVLKANHS